MTASAEQPQEPLMAVPDGKRQADRYIDIPAHPSGGEGSGALAKLMDRPVAGVTELGSPR